MFSDKLITTFEILITAYFIGRPSALILEKGINLKEEKNKLIDKFFDNKLERIENEWNTIIEELKKRAPIWKKEHYVDGDEDWLLGHELMSEHDSK